MQSTGPVWVCPLWHSLLAIGVGVLCAFSLSLAIFREVHVIALLFGSSLIGTTVDYCMHYFCEVFVRDGARPWDRLRRVLPGLSLGIATTLIGYSILLLAPFTGLHQIAVFSASGMLASFATVVLWLPFLDRRREAAHGDRFLAATSAIWRFWETSAPRWFRCPRRALDCDRRCLAGGVEAITHNGRSA